MQARMGLTRSAARMRVVCFEHAVVSGEGAAVEAGVQLAKQSVLDVAGERSGVVHEGQELVQIGRVVVGHGFSELVRL